MQKIVIICNDIFGLEVYSIIEEINKWHLGRNGEPKYQITGFLWIDSLPFNAEDSPVPMIGNVDNWNFTDDIKVVIGIKAPSQKMELVQALKKKHAQYETIIAPWMLSFPEWLTIGEGSIVAPYSAKPGMVIGSFVTIIHSMLSGHGIGNYSTVMRFANIAGESIGKNSYIGDHAFLAVGRSIGDDCYVADGSIVVKNVKNNSCVSGVPAKKVK